MNKKVFVTLFFKLFLATLDRSIAAVLKQQRKQKIGFGVAVVHVVGDRVRFQPMGNYHNQMLEKVFYIEWRHKRVPLFVRLWNARCVIHCMHSKPGSGVPTPKSV